MTTRAVHWHEGMFLRPHHLQAAERHGLEQSRRGEKWDCEYNWGLRSIDLDTAALANNRLVVRSLRARLRDGTLLVVPDDGILPQVLLKEALDQRPTVDAFLAVPVLRLGRANTATDPAADGAQGARYHTDVQPIEDENTGVNAQEIEVRLFNLKLLLSTQDLAGYEVIPIARIRKADAAGAPPELDQAYIPPALACDAWPPLQKDFLEYVYHRIGSKLTELAQRAEDGNVMLRSQTPDDVALLDEYRALNEAEAMLRVLALAKGGGVHPFMAYTELCRVAGRLAHYGTPKNGKPKRVRELPLYDHDDLGTCFVAVRQYLEELLLPEPPPSWSRPFKGREFRMEVKLDPEWLTEGYPMYVGVKSTLPQARCKELFAGAQQHKIEMKIASPDRVDRIFQGGFRGFNFRSVPTPHSLPGDYVYFQVDWTADQTERLYVERTHSLAIRLNVKHFNDTKIDGQEREFTLTHVEGVPGSLKMEFRLFVVRKTA